MQCRDGELSVNLLISRPSPWADVESHIPYTGRVDVKIKQALNPESAAPGLGVSTADPLPFERR